MKICPSKSSYRISTTFYELSFPIPQPHLRSLCVPSRTTLVSRDVDALISLSDTAWAAPSLYTQYRAF